MKIKTEDGRGCLSHLWEHFPICVSSAGQIFHTLMAVFACIVPQLSVVMDIKPHTPGS